MTHVSTKFSPCVVSCPLIFLLFYCIAPPRMMYSQFPLVCSRIIIPLLFCQTIHSLLPPMIAALCFCPDVQTYGMLLLPCGDLCRVPLVPLRYEVSHPCLIARPISAFSHFSCCIPPCCKEEIDCLLHAQLLQPLLFCVFSSIPFKMPKPIGRRLILAAVILIGSNALASLPHISIVLRSRQKSHIRSIPSMRYFLHLWPLTPFHHYLTACSVDHTLVIFPELLLVVVPSIFLCCTLFNPSTLSILPLQLLCLLPNVLPGMVLQEHWFPLYPFLVCNDAKMIHS